MLLLVAREWRRLYPRGNVLRIGDISRPDGGRFPPHKTHRDGLSVDIFTSPKNVCHVAYPDQKQTLELARLFFRFGARQILYNHAYVLRNQRGVRSWPRHHNHFHVVCDPRRVPKEGGPFLVVAADRTVLGPRAVRRGKDGEVAFRLPWSYMAPVAGWQRSYRLVVTLAPEGTPVYDSGEVASGRTFHDVRTRLAGDRPYCWRVTVRSRRGPEQRSAWVGLVVDLDPPVVTGVSPVEGRESGEIPELSWRLSDASGQGSFVVELSAGEKGTSSFWRSERVESSSRRLSPKVRLGPGRTYSWRVRITDLAGNQGVSPWYAFRTPARVGPGTPGVVTSLSLNFRTGPGKRYTRLGALGRGDALRVLGREASGWLKVAVKGERGWQVGYVHARYVKW